MGQQVTEVMCCAAPRSLRPLQHKFWRSKQKGNSWSLSDWCQPVPLSFQLLYSISLSSLFCLHLYLFSLIKDRFTHMCAHTHTHTHETHTCMCTHVWHTQRHTLTCTHTKNDMCAQCIPWSKLCSTCSVRDPSNSSSAWNRKLRYELHTTS